MYFVDAFKIRELDELAIDDSEWSELYRYVMFQGHGWAIRYDRHTIGTIIMYVF